VAAEDLEDQTGRIRCVRAGHMTLENASISLRQTEQTDTKLDVHIGQRNAGCMEWKLVLRFR
jgi:hypothetical protein